MDVSFESNSNDGSERTVGLDQESQNPFGNDMRSMGGSHGQGGSLNNDDY